MAVDTGGIGSISAGGSGGALGGPGSGETTGSAGGFEPALSAGSPDERMSLFGLVKGCVKGLVSVLPIAQQALPRVHSGFWWSWSSVREGFPQPYRQPYP